MVLAHVILELLHQKSVLVTKLFSMVRYSLEVHRVVVIKEKVTSLQMNCQACGRARQNNMGRSNEAKGKAKEEPHQS